MSHSSAFGIIGGDQRQIYLARSIAADGYPVWVSCLEKGKGTEGLPAAGLKELTEKCSVVILPLPVTRNGKTLNAPFSEEEILLDDSFASLFLGKAVYGGMMEKLYGTSEVWGSVASYDYYSREELMVGNAFLTAEGAIGMAIREYEGALNSSRCLVTGFGRIGKALCLMLKGLGAQTDCCARNAADLTAIRALGCGALRYRELGGDYNVVFNTVPAQVLTAKALARQRPNTLFLELASHPGGIDLEAARRLKLRVLDAPSLPGRMSPKAAGELIKETIYHMIEEV